MNMEYNPKNTNLPPFRVLSVVASSLCSFVEEFKWVSQLCVNEYYETAICCKMLKPTVLGIVSRCGDYSWRQTQCVRRLQNSGLESDSRKSCAPKGGGGKFAICEKVVRSVFPDFC